ncbi:MAG: hypothetical protein JWL93_1387 [Hyphomicrobiales bacterium]|nr:hypothetical protein [Hyphomicrobiales bacterium]
MHGLGKSLNFFRPGLADARTRVRIIAAIFAGNMRVYMADTDEQPRLLTNMIPRSVYWIAVLLNLAIAAIGLAKWISCMPVAHTALIGGDMRESDG